MDSNRGYFEIYSGKFPAGQVCIGGNGCDKPTMLADTEDGTCSNYVVFVGPDDLEPFFPGGSPASARYFDGDSDYVAIPKLNGGGKNPKGSFDVITIDTWIKFAAPETGKHPIMNEDHWDTGDLHYQLYEGDMGISVNPNDYSWGPNLPAGTGGLSGQSGDESFFPQVGFGRVLALCKRPSSLYQIY